MNYVLEYKKKLTFLTTMGIMCLSTHTSHKADSEISCLNDMYLQLKNSPFCNFKLYSNHARFMIFNSCSLNILIDLKRKQKCVLDGVTSV